MGVNENRKERNFSQPPTPDFYHTYNIFPFDLLLQSETQKHYRHCQKIILASLFEALGFHVMP